MYSALHTIFKLVPSSCISRSFYGENIFLCQSLTTVMLMYMLTKSGRWRKYNMTFQNSLLTPPHPLYHVLYRRPSKDTNVHFLLHLPNRSQFPSFPCAGENDESLNWDFWIFGWLALNVFNPFLRCLFCFPSSSHALLYGKANHRSSNIVRKCYPRECFLVSHPYKWKSF